MGRNWKQWQILFWGGSKITADGDCSHEIKRYFLLGRKITISLDSVSKSRDITLPTKICIVKAMVFPIVTYGCESWTIKKAEQWRTDACELWYWRRILKIPWTARSSQSIINIQEISHEYSLEGLMLKLKLQYFGHLMRRTDVEAEPPILWPPDTKNWLIWKDSDAGKDWRQEEKETTEDEVVGWHH